MARFFIWDEDTSSIEVEGDNVDEAIRAWFDHDGQEDARDNMIANGFRVRVARAADVDNRRTARMHAETYSVNVQTRLECSKVA